MVGICRAECAGAGQRLDQWIGNARRNECRSHEERELFLQARAHEVPGFRRRRISRPVRGWEPALSGAN